MTVGAIKTLRVIVISLVALGVVPLAVVAGARQATVEAVTAARQAFAPSSGSVGSMAAAVRAARVTAFDSRRDASTSNGVLGDSTQVEVYLWTMDNAPIADAAIQLRDVLTEMAVGAPAAGMKGTARFTDRAGNVRFVFDKHANLTGRYYVAEYWSHDVSKLIMVGEPFEIMPGQTVVTYIRLANAVPLIPPALARSILASVLEVAASVGVSGIQTPAGSNPPPVASSIR